jgi:AmiR/NasT family two-component response regulator
VLLNEQLQSAFRSRVVIEQAKGVLSLQFGESVAASFERLRQYARSRNGKLAAIAAQVVRREIGLTGFAAPQRRPDGDPDRR